MERKEDKQNSLLGFQGCLDIGRKIAEDGSPTHKQKSTLLQPSPLSTASSGNQQGGCSGQQQNSSDLLRPSGIDHIPRTNVSSSLVNRCNSIEDVGTPLVDRKSSQGDNLPHGDFSIASPSVDQSGGLRCDLPKPPLSEGNCSEDMTRRAARRNRDTYDYVEIVDDRVIIKAKPRKPPDSPKLCASWRPTVSLAERNSQSPTPPIKSNGLGNPRKPAAVKSLIHMFENQTVSPKKPQARALSNSSPKLVSRPDNDHLYEEVAVEETNPKGCTRESKGEGTSPEAGREGEGTRTEGGRESSSEESESSVSNESCNDDDEEGAAWSDVDDDEHYYDNLEAYQNVEISDMEKDHQVVYEMVTTERTYVKKLQYLHQACKETENLLGRTIARELFPHIENIYQLHNEYLLPRLEERLILWQGTKKIGDIMKIMAPLLKMYTAYIRNFDKTLGLIEQWQQRSPEFSMFVKLQATNSTGIKVHLRTHMIEPIQRVPRYELLLKEYLKHLPKDSTEYADVEEALVSISEAAKHFEAGIQQEAEMRRLIVLQQQIDSPISIVTRSRQLVKEGKILKVCVKTGKVFDFYLFLFNDLLLLCKEQFIHIAGITPKYKVKLLMELDGMEIRNGDSSDVLSTFYVKTRQKTLKLAADDDDEKGEWTQVLWKMVGNKMRKNLQKEYKRQTNCCSISVSSPNTLPQPDDDHFHKEVAVKGTKPEESVLEPNGEGAGIEAGQESSSEESDSSLCYESDDDGEGTAWSDLDDEDNDYENLEVYQKVEIGAMEKDHQVVYEMLTTERTYVEKLQYLHEACKETERILGRTIARDMFPHIENIYALHKEYLLPRLEERLILWQGTKKIGDIMKYLAPFLKMYTAYIRNFDKTLGLIEQWQQMSLEFFMMVSLQTTNSTGIKVHLRTHMIEPIQRVPRYELLLKEYLKHVPKDSTDHADVEDALVSISEVARHFEAGILQETQMHRLIVLQQQIDSPVSIVTPSRQLIKEGKILKVCATTGKVVNRYLFVFNDLLLLCKEQFIHIAGITPKYKVKLLMELDGMEITNGDSLEVSHTFYVKTRQKALELAAEDADEKEEWTQVLLKVVNGNKMMQRKHRRRRRTGSRTAQGCRSRDEFLFKDYLYLSEDLGCSWHRRVLAISESGQLICFGAQQPVSPRIAVMLAQCDVVFLTFPGEYENVVHLVTPTRQYYVRDNSAEKLMKFLDTLEGVMKVANESFA